MGAGGSTHPGAPAGADKTKSSGGKGTGSSGATTNNTNNANKNAMGSLAKQSGDPARNYRFVAMSVPPGKALRPKLIGFVQAADELIRGADGSKTNSASAAAAENNNNNNNNNNAAATNMGWFVEDPLRPGQWEPYNDESTTRLEAAFLSHKDAVMVVHKKHTCTVNLTAMLQLPATSAATSAAAAAAATGASKVAGSRMVRRAVAEEVVDPATGERTRRLAPVGTIDPFDDDGEEADANAANTDEGGAAPEQPSASANAELLFAPATTPGSLADRAAKDGTFQKLYPCFVSDAKLHAGPIYTMAAWEPAPTPENHQNVHNQKIRLLSGGKDRSLIEWDPVAPTVTGEYSLGSVAPNLSILNAAISRSGRFALVGMDDRDARVYALPPLDDAAAAAAAMPVTREVLWKLKGHTHKVYGVDFVAGEEQCVTAGMDGVVCGWSLQSAAQPGKPHLQETPLFAHHCHCSHIFAIKMSRVCNYFGVSVGDDKIVCVHDFRMANAVAQRLAGHSKTIWNVDIHPDEQQLVTCGMDSTVKLWDLRQPGEARWTSTVHTKAIHDARFTPRGRGVLSCGKDQHVLLTAADTGAPVWRLRAHQASVFRALPVAGGGAIVTCAADAHAYMYKWEDGVNW